ncbi:methylglyoxal reductase (NADPH-dependent) gre2 [Pleurotus ostreatus]|uniref:Methylglyoxal reductase (NADPH-dependent) gre2 n=1 Tax=Pleurotus ostreatus TaxID=5322 RepID=A0A8H7A7L7_PLEOS|nr:methylglyoxal reductase (NADPH-dependent) gre2 [Pleurotus ostreatus]KAF7437550.1 methylglyoxal reductase (NADPH-dependent) gre2 [Pleurotus ostreatus]
MSILAAWEFYDKHKAEITWDVVVINPFVFGPVIHDVASCDTLNTSSSDLLKVLPTPSTSLSAMSSETLTPTGSCWIDVRDLAEGHAKALEVPDAGGERIIISAGPYVWQDWIDVAQGLSPSVALPYCMVKEC